MVVNVPIVKLKLNHLHRFSEHLERNFLYLRYQKRVAKVNSHGALLQSQREVFEMNDQSIRQNVF